MCNLHFFFKNFVETYLQRYRVVAILVAFLHLQFLSLLEPPEVVLNEEGCVELAHRHFVVHCKKNRFGDEKYLAKWFIQIFKLLRVPPGGGTTWSRSFGLVRFQIFFMTARNSAFASSMLPSVFIRSDVRTTANSVALNRTVPSLFSGIFIDTSLCNYENGILFI